MAKPSKKAPELVLPPEPTLDRGHEDAQRSDENEIEVSDQSSAAEGEGREDETQLSVVPSPSRLPVGASALDASEEASSSSAEESEAEEPTRAAFDPDAKPKRVRKSWRQRISLSGMILWTVLLSITGAGAAAGYYAIAVLYENKLNDTWAILFLELEQKGARLAQKLEQFTNQRGGATEGAAAPRRMPDEILHAVSSEKLAKIRGSFPETIQLSDLRIASVDMKERFNILQFAGTDYLAVDVPETAVTPLLNQPMPPGRYLLLWKAEIDSWFLDATDDPNKNTLYLVTKEGRTIFSNDPDITEKTYINRPLVQKFVANPLRAGQLEFDGPDGPAYGFFYEVPGTNIMMFVETTKKVALAAVRETAVQFAIVLVMILALVGILLQFPLGTLTGPLRELVRLAWEIGEGNFNVKPQVTGFGELNLLTRAFTDMGKSLQEREERIQLLLVEQQEKFRLVDDLAVATSIQNTFLFKSPMPSESGIEVATHYVPAAEVAGDWYGYFYDEGTGESIFAVADVSGHGAGSAMFTAIIAAMFEETRSTPGNFPMVEFAKRANRMFLALGQGKMHATLVMARYQKGSKQVEVLNAGHPSPLLIYTEESGQRNEPVVVRSDYLGSSPEFDPRTETVPFEPGTSILLYTDGLIEGRPDHKLYTERRLSKKCVQSSNQSMDQLVTRIADDWKEHLENQQPLDDVCLMAVRAKA